MLLSVDLIQSPRDVLAKAVEDFRSGRIEESVAGGVKTGRAQIGEHRGELSLMSFAPAQASEPCDLCVICGLGHAL